MNPTHDGHPTKNPLMKMIHDTLTIVILLLYTAVNFGVVNSEMLVASFSGSSVINASLSPSAESFIPVDSDINLALLA